jgi:hypothetical protein
MFLRKLLVNRVVPKAVINFSTEEMSNAIQINRKSLDLVDNWIDDAAFQRSFFQYGVPDFIKVNLNKKINEDPTYSDYLLFLAKKHFTNVSYLEIGVSVGKNFFQMLNGLGNAIFTGFDIEEINPVLARRLTFTNSKEWETPANSIKKNMSSLKEYNFNGKEVNCLSADVWDENSWSKLNGNKYNLVFSDALHTPEAILFEFEMLVKYQLLANKFIIVWDDLVNQMKDAFFAIIKKYNKIYRIKDVYLIQANGWVGEFEGPHSVGIISNFCL